MFNKIATTAAGTIPEPPKINWIPCGSAFKIAVFAPRPYPRPKETETIVIFLVSNGYFVINWIPLTTIEENIITATGKEAVIMSAAIYVNREYFKGMSDEEIVAKTKADVSDSNKGQPSYRKVQNVYVSFEEFEKNSTRKVIRQKVIDRYTKTIAK